MGDCCSKISSSNVHKPGNMVTTGMDSTVGDVGRTDSSIPASSKIQVDSGGNAGTIGEDTQVDSLRESCAQALDVKDIDASKELVSIIRDQGMEHVLKEEHLKLANLINECIEIRSKLETGINTSNEALLHNLIKEVKLSGLEITIGDVFYESQELLGNVQSLRERSYESISSGDLESCKSILREITDRNLKGFLNREFEDLEALLKTDHNLKYRLVHALREKNEYELTYLMEEIKERDLESSTQAQFDSASKWLEALKNIRSLASSAYSENNEEYCRLIVQKIKDISMDKVLKTELVLLETKLDHFDKVRKMFSDVIEEKNEMKLDILLNDTSYKGVDLGELFDKIQVFKDNLSNYRIRIDQNINLKKQNNLEALLQDIEFEGLSLALYPECEDIKEILKRLTHLSEELHFGIQSRNEYLVSNILQLAQKDHYVLDEAEMGNIFLKNIRFLQTSSAEALKSKSLSQCKWTLHKIKEMKYDTCLQYQVSSLAGFIESINKYQQDIDNAIASKDPKYTYLLTEINARGLESEVGVSRVNEYHTMINNYMNNEESRVVALENIIEENELILTEQDNKLKYQTEIYNFEIDEANKRISLLQRVSTEKKVESKGSIQVHELIPEEKESEPSPILKESKPEPSPILKSKAESSADEYSDTQVPMRSVAKKVGHRRNISVQVVSPDITDLNTTRSAVGRKGNRKMHKRNLSAIPLNSPESTPVKRHKRTSSHSYEEVELVTDMGSTFILWTVSQLRSFNDYSKRTFGVKKEDSMYVWQSKPIPRSIFQYSVEYCGNKNLYKAMKKDSLDNFKIILAYMEDKSNTNPHVLAYDLLLRGSETELIRDDIYCQLVKQTTDNPNEHSLIRGWKLIYLCLSTFLVQTKEMEHVLRSHISSVASIKFPKYIPFDTVGNVAANCWRVLEAGKTVMDLPSIEDIKNITERISRPLTLFTESGEIIELDIDSSDNSMSFKELSKIAMQRMGKEGMSCEIDVLSRYSRLEEFHSYRVPHSKSVLGTIVHWEGEHMTNPKLEYRFQISEIFQLDSLAFDEIKEIDSFSESYTLSLSKKESSYSRSQLGDIRKKKKERDEEARKEKERMEEEKRKLAELKRIEEREERDRKLAKELFLIRMKEEEEFKQKKKEEEKHRLEVEERDRQLAEQIRLLREEEEHAYRIKKAEEERIRLEKEEQERIRIGEEEKEKERLRLEREEELLIQEEERVRKEFEAEEIRLEAIRAARKLKEERELEHKRIEEEKEKERLRLVEEERKRQKEDEDIRKQKEALERARRIEEAEERRKRKEVEMRVREARRKDLDDELFNAYEMKDYDAMERIVTELNPIYEKSLKLKPKLLNMATEVVVEIQTKRSTIEKFQVGLNKLDRDMLKEGLLLLKKVEIGPKYTDIVKEAKRLCYALSDVQFRTEQFNVAIKRKDTVWVQELIKEARKVGKNEEDVDRAQRFLNGGDEVKSIASPKKKKQHKRVVSSFQTQNIQSMEQEFKSYINLYPLSEFPLVRNFEDYSRKAPNLTRKDMFQWQEDVLERTIYKYTPELFDSKATYRNVKKLAVANFKNILRFMGDRHHEDPKPLAQKIIQGCIDQPLLRDSNYLQIVKQTTNNPSGKSTLLGWKLLYLCLSSFPPHSEDMKNVLLSHIAAHANPKFESYMPMDTIPNVAANCWKSFQNISKTGAKSKAPEMKRILDLFTIHSIPFRVFIGSGGNFEQLKVTESEGDRTVGSITETLAKKVKVSASSVDLRVHSNHISSDKSNDYVISAGDSILKVIQHWKGEVAKNPTLEYSFHLDIRDDIIEEEKNIPAVIPKKASVLGFIDDSDDEALPPPDDDIDLAREVFGSHAKGDFIPFKKYSDRVSKSGAYPSADRMFSTPLPPPEELGSMADMVPPPPLESDKGMVPPPPLESGRGMVPPPPLESDKGMVPPPPLESGRGMVPPPPLESDKGMVPPPPLESMNDMMPPPPLGSIRDMAIPPSGPPSEFGSMKSNTSSDDEPLPPPP